MHVHSHKHCECICIVHLPYTRIVDTEHGDWYSHLDYDCIRINIAIAFIIQERTLPIAMKGGNIVGPPHVHSHKHCECICIMHMLFLLKVT